MRGSTFATNGGSIRSRAITKKMRVWPSSEHSATLVVPASTPIVIDPVDERVVQRGEGGGQRGVLVDLLPRHDAHQHDRDRAVDDRSDRERAEDAERDVALRIVVHSSAVVVAASKPMYVKKTSAAAGTMPSPLPPENGASEPQPSGMNGVRLCTWNSASPTITKTTSAQDLEHDEDVVRRRRFADAQRQQRREHEHEQRADRRRIANAAKSQSRDVPPRGRA